MQFDIIKTLIYLRDKHKSVINNIIKKIEK